MRIGVCTGIDGFGQAADGLTYFEPTVADLLCPAESEDVFERRRTAAMAAPVKPEAVCCLFPGSLKTTGPAVDTQAVDAWMATTCRRAARAGVKRIVYGSGSSRRAPDGFDVGDARGQIVEHLKRFGPMAASCELEIVLEPLSGTECNVVMSVEEGAELVRRADHPNIRLLADTYHMSRNGEPADSIRGAGGLITHAHCAEGDGRGPLGTLGEDQRAYFRALRDIGYDQRISIEASWKDFGAQLDGAVAELWRQWETA